MNKFIDKRNSLEQFVKEQIIGPGAYNNRFFFLKGVIGLFILTKKTHFF